MSTHVQTALQTRLYAILTGDSTLMGLISGVYDFVPDSKAFPFVTIGDDVFVYWDNHSNSGFQGTMTIHSWSQAAGKNEVMTIMNRVYTLVHDVDLSISGFKTVACRCSSHRVMIDPDGYTHHGVQTFSFLIGGN